MKQCSSSRTGFGLIEIIIASALVSMAIGSVAYVFGLTTRLTAQSSDSVRAVFLAEEGTEVMRFLRDSGWMQNIAPLALGTTYYLFFDTATSQWSTTTINPGLIDNTFTRTIVVSGVSRDASDTIVALGGINDPNSRKIAVTVLWSNAKTIFLESYLSDIFKN